LDEQDSMALEMAVVKGRTNSLARRDWRATRDYSNACERGLPNGM
jgi:hypothetical protein